MKFIDEDDITELNEIDKKCIHSSNTLIKS